MAEIKWIKITTDIFDDEKILLIESMPDADAIIVIWFKLLVLAGKTNNCGLLTINDTIPYNDEMLATIFRRPLNTVRLALEIFEQFGMIDIINDTIAIPKWEKHQNIEGMDKIREQTRERVARFREREKLKQIEGDVTESNVTVTQQNKNKDKDKDKKNKKGRFAPPTLSEVQAYVNEKGYHIDAESFIDFYASKGWMVGKNKMKDWKAAVRTWEKRRKDEQRMGQVHNGTTDQNGRGVAGTAYGSGSGTEAGKVTFPRANFGFEEEE